MLPSGLGTWIMASHRIWPWFHDVKWDIIYCQTLSSFTSHVLIVQTQTRTGNLYVQAGEESTILVRVVPVRISPVARNVIALGGEGPPTPPWQQGQLDFWESLRQQGGSWMWMHVCTKSLDMKWLADALKTGTTIILSDGSHSKKGTPCLWHWLGNSLQ
jgi:hypothetical protein